jgi:aminotransferase in exopolysaccharide biosynthesis
MEKSKAIVSYIKSLYPNMDPVLLHCPKFLGKEKEYLAECIDTEYVSYVGRFVVAMEEKIKQITSAKYAVAMVNGTEALHIALLAAGITPGDEIITQALTFAATAAAIVHSQASPIFVDVDRDTLGMSPNSLETFLTGNTEIRNGRCYNLITGKQIKAVVPMHTFGHPVRIDAIKRICDSYSLMLIEDSAESLGSYFKDKHTGTFGKAGILSFNGNKLVTTGGGGMLITDDEALATKAKYISTTAKRPHRWEFYHDDVGFNLRMPSLNAAVGFAQLEYFDKILENKRQTAELYLSFFQSLDIPCVHEPSDTKANYWLNAIYFENKDERDRFLEYSNTNGVQTRPTWTLMYKLPPYSNYQRTDMTNSEYIESRLVNIPSSLRV